MFKVQVIPVMKRKREFEVFERRRCKADAAADGNIIPTIPLRTTRMASSDVLLVQDGGTTRIAMLLTKDSMPKFLIK